MEYEVLEEEAVNYYGEFSQDDYEEFIFPQLEAEDTDY